MKFIQSLLILIISIVAIATAQDSFYVQFSKTSGNPMCSANYNPQNGICVVPCSKDVSFRLDASLTSTAYNFTTFSDTNCTTMSLREQSSSCFVGGHDSISGGGYLYNITCTPANSSGSTTSTTTSTSSTPTPDHHHNGNTAPIVVASLSTIILAFAVLLL